MESSHLRIGNLLECDSPKRVHQIHEEWFRIGDYESRSCNSKHCGIKPILLTPEILQKIGFTPSARMSVNSAGLDAVNIAFVIRGYDSDIVLKDNFGYANEWHVYAEFNAEGIHIGKPITYVHQLQNLYFALTGQELHIEL